MPERMDRLPAIPLIASDPYFSVWMPADTPTETESCHWSGAVQPLHGEVTVDGVPFRFLGVTSKPAAQLTSLRVTPLTTAYTMLAAGIRLEVRFTTPALPADLDLLSMPITLVSLTVSALDGVEHDVSLSLHVSDRMCYSGEARPELYRDVFALKEGHAAVCGQRKQKLLCHSADKITIDWGYLYLASDSEVSWDEEGLMLAWQGRTADAAVQAVLAYDDVVSVNYLGTLCKAWYRRNGAQITDAVSRGLRDFRALCAACDALDEKLLADAEAAGGAAYARIVSAAWRQTFAAHKLVASPTGQLLMFSKENDSNGCIGTVDVSYPSIPLFLKYCPQLVQALCEPVLEFASLPVWGKPFAPHDLGRYPYATGQVYAARTQLPDGGVYPPWYLYPASAEIYDPNMQMPVEECGNMLLMLSAAAAFGAGNELLKRYRPLLEQWAQYLLENGEDPGEQLCTDDFAGHLAHNANLAAKAMTALMSYGRATGNEALCAQAQSMAKRFEKRMGQTGNTPLTLDGQGWSMKYNLLWDKVLKLGLLPERFYTEELRSYLPRIERYGLPLDGRDTCTKSDWICWTAALSDDGEVRETLLAPIAAYLQETTSRVAFSDWYDARTGKYRSFIARSVQGGVFAPMLRPLHAPLDEKKEG